jgi:hypothetical protein
MIEIRSFLLKELSYFLPRSFLEGMVQFLVNLSSSESEDPVSEIHVPHTGAEKGRITFIEPWFSSSDRGSGLLFAAVV